MGILAGIAVIAAVLFLVIENGARSGYALDLSNALKRGDLSIDGHPWLSTLAQDLLNAGAAQEPNGKELTLRLHPLRVRGVKSPASGLFYYYPIKDEQRLMQVTLEFPLEKEEEYITLLEAFERDMTEALRVNADLRNEQNTKELYLASFYKLDQSASATWYAAGFQGAGGAPGTYTLRLTAYRADPNLRSAYGESLEVLVLINLRIMPYRKSLSGESSDDDLILSLPAFES